MRLKFVNSETLKLYAGLVKQSAKIDLINSLKARVMGQGKGQIPEAKAMLDT